MASVLSIVGVAFAAFSVWLTVRIVNRRERWAKWTLATIFGLPLAYVASFGPACALADRGMLPRTTLDTTFSPCLFLVTDGPNPFGTALWEWAALCGDEHVLVTLVLERAGAKYIITY